METTNILESVKEYINKLYSDQYERFMNEHPTSSVPVAMFSYSSDEEESVFNPSNWNSGQDIIRHFLLAYYDSSLPNHFDVYFNGNRVVGFIQYLDDEWYGDIVVYNKMDNVRSSYFIKWYKNRGRTSMVLKNGEPITLEEYSDLIVTLAQANLVNIVLSEEMTEGDIKCTDTIINITFPCKSSDTVNENRKAIRTGKIEKNLVYGYYGIMKNKTI